MKKTRVTKRSGPRGSVTTKRMSSKPRSSSKQAKKDAYALGGQTRAGKAIAKKRTSRAAANRARVMNEIKKTRGK